MIKQHEIKALDYNFLSYQYKFVSYPPPWLPLPRLLLSRIKNNKHPKLGSIYTCVLDTLQPESVGQIQSIRFLKAMLAT